VGKTRDLLGHALEDGIERSPVRLVEAGWALAGLQHVDVLLELVLAVALTGLLVERKAPVSQGDRLLVAPHDAHRRECGALADPALALREVANGRHEAGHLAGGIEGRAGGCRRRPRQEQGQGQTETYVPPSHF